MRPEDNATDDIFDWAARDPDHAAFGRKVDGEWRPMTSKEFADQVTAVAAGLIAVGIEPGDRIALFSATRFEWLLADFAIWTAGAVTVPIYETSSLEQVRWILSDSGAVGLFAENEQLAAVAGRAARRIGTAHMAIRQPVRSTNSGSTARTYRWNVSRSAAAA